MSQREMVCFSLIVNLLTSSLASGMNSLSHTHSVQSISLCQYLAPEEHEIVIVFLELWFFVSQHLLDSVSPPTPCVEKFLLANIQGKKFGDSFIKCLDVRVDLLLPLKSKLVYNSEIKASGVLGTADFHFVRPKDD